MPNGTPRKLLNSDRIKSLGWTPQIRLEDGISSTIEWYKEASTNGKVRL
jgi:GDP-L-fucose synthase